MDNKGGDNRSGQIVVVGVGPHDVNASQQDRRQDNRDPKNDPDGD
jgi:hypothetical protein